MRELFSENTRTNAFEFFNDFVNCHEWISRNEQMYMIRHYFKGNNVNPYLIGFIFNNLHKPISYFVFKDRTPSFWTPYQMVVQEIYTVLIVLIIHVDRLQYIYIIVKEKIEEILAIHPLTKVRGFLAKTL